MQCNVTGIVWVEAGRDFHTIGNNVCDLKSNLEFVNVDNLQQTYSAH